MRLSTVCAFLICCMAMTATVYAEIISIDGTVKSIDVKKRTITVETGSKELTLDVGSKAKIKIGEEVESLESLAVGQKVSVSFHDELEVAVEIETIDVPPSPENPESISLLSEDITNHWNTLGMDGVKGWKKVGEELHSLPLKDVPLLLSKQKYGDFEFTCDFLLGEKANSGIYLRGRYEVQLIDDGSFDNVPDKNRCGSVVGQIAPSENVYRGPNEWNSLSIRLEGKTVSIQMNDTTIIESEQIEHITSEAVDKQEDLPGPLALQNRGGTIKFRKMRMLPLSPVSTPENDSPMPPKDAVRLVRIEILRKGNWIAHKVVHRGNRMFIVRSDGVEVPLKRQGTKLVFTTVFKTPFEFDTETNMSNTKEPLRFVYE